jgi:hypothetical protein
VHVIIIPAPNRRISSQVVRLQALKAADGQCIYQGCASSQSLTDTWPIMVSVFERLGHDKLEMYVINFGFISLACL